MGEGGGITPYTPATRTRTQYGPTLDDLLKRVDNMRPFQDVNLPDAPTVTRPTVGMPNRRDYGTADRSSLMDLRRSATRTRNEFYNPTESDAFKNLMNLASMQTARSAEEADRTGREAAARRGFTGGYSVSAERTARDRMRGLALAGGENAAAIRKEAGGLLAEQEKAYAGLAGDIEGADTTRSVQFAKDLSSAREMQGQLDLGYGNQLVDLYGARNQAILGQGQLRETGRGNDLDALTRLAQLSLEDYTGQNEMALLQEKFRLEEEAAQASEGRRRQAKEWDFEFGEKRASDARTRSFEDLIAQDPRARYLANAAASNPEARSALEQLRRSYRF